MQTCNIMGVNIAVTDMDKTLRLVEDNCEAWRGKYICVANVHTTVTAHDDPTYLRVQNGAVMALPDGGPLSRYSRKKGFADAARVTGPDLMRELLKESGTKHYRHYFYGSTQETLDILREKSRKSTRRGHRGDVLSRRSAPDGGRGCRDRGEDQRGKAGFCLGGPGRAEAGALDGRP